LRIPANLSGRRALSRKDITLPRSGARAARALSTSVTNLQAALAPDLLLHHPKFRSEAFTRTPAIPQAEWRNML